MELQKITTSPLLSNNVINPFLAPLHFFSDVQKRMGVPRSRPERSHTAGGPPAPDTGLHKPVSAWKTRDWALCEGCRSVRSLSTGSSAGGRKAQRVLTCIEVKLSSLARAACCVTKASAHTGAWLRCCPARLPSGSGSHAPWGCCPKPDLTGVW